MKHTTTALLLSLSALPAAAQNQLWVKQLGTSADEFVYASASDGSDGAYICGATQGSLGGPSAGLNDAWLARYDSAGNVLWTRQLGTSSFDYAYAVAPDGASGVYMSGLTGGSLGGANAGSHDTWLARYDSAGNLLWIRQIGTADADYLLAATSDGTSGVCVTGYTGGSLGNPSAGGIDAWLARYDNAGNQLWIRQLGTSFDDYATAAASDGSGSLFVGGWTTGSLGGQTAGNADAWLARYDGAGNQLWIEQLGTASYEEVYAAAVDGAGGVYVAGYASGDFGGPNAGLGDAWLARYDGAGNRLWIRQLGSSSDDQISGAAPDGAGGVYVGGTTFGDLGGPSAGSGDAWLARYVPTGNQLWIVQFGTHSNDGASTCTPDGSGGAYVSGGTAANLGGQNAGGYDAFVSRYDTCSPQPYCIGAINTTGQGASIGHQGSTSIAQNDLVLTVQGCPPFQPGIFFFGLFQTQVAFGDGWLCVTGQQKRLLPAVFINSSGAGTYQVDFTNPLSPASTIQPGDVRNFQFWYRDPQPVGSGFNLSNGLSAYFCP